MINMKEIKQQKQSKKWSKNMEGKETKKAKRTSILDYHLEEIKELRKLDLNSMAIYKIIKSKVPQGIGYDAVLRYIKRERL